MAVEVMRCQWKRFWKSRILVGMKKAHLHSGASSRWASVRTNHPGRADGAGCAPALQACHAGVHGKMSEAHQFL